MAVRMWVRMDCRPQSTACVARLTTHRARVTGRAARRMLARPATSAHKTTISSAAKRKTKPILEALSERQVLRGLGMAGAGCDDAMSVRISQLSR